MEITNKKRACEETLIRVLSTMEAAGIRTLQDLQKEKHAQLYTTLWFALEDFINNGTMRSKTHTKRDGKVVEGSYYKIKELMELGAELEDLQGIVLLHLIENIHHLMNCPADQWGAYCETVTYNCLVTEYRKMCPKGQAMQSIDKVIGDQDDDDFTLKDTLAAPDTPADWVMAHESAEEQRDAILNDLYQLRSTDQRFVYLCSYDQMRPRHIYNAVEQLAAQGCDPQEISNVISEHICRKYYIPRTEMPTLLSKPLSRSMVDHLSTHDRDVITNKISDVKLTLPAAMKKRLKERQRSAS